MQQIRSELLFITPLAFLKKKKKMLLPYAVHVLSMLLFL